MLFRLLAFAAIVALSAGTASAAPKVAASIAPVHSIVARVMAGAGAPTLLVPQDASPHDFALKPSTARAIAEANVVFWIGEALEPFLERPLDNLGQDADAVALMEAPGVLTLPTRDIDLEDDHAAHGQERDHDADQEHDKDHADHDKDHDAHDKDHGRGHEHGHAHDHGAIDPHIWLDPRNARAIAQTAAETLAAADPANAPLYRANAVAFDREMDGLEARLKTKLAGAAATPIVIFHDAYQYFEHRFGLNVVAVATINPETPLSARRLSDIRKRMADAGVKCIFVEPQFSAAALRNLAPGPDVPIATLDPLGAVIPTGPGHYPRLLEDIVEAASRCANG